MENGVIINVVTAGLSSAVHLTTVSAPPFNHNKHSFIKDTPNNAL